MKHRVLGSILAIALVGMTVVVASPVSAGTRVHEPSGIALVGPVDLNPAPTSDSLAHAHGDAIRLAQSNPRDFGYPWIDRRRGRLQIIATTTHGADLATTFRARRSGVAMHLSNGADRSWALLEHIKDEAIALKDLGIPGASAIFETEPDEENNRVIITVDELNEDLMVALSKRYGTEAIAVRYEPLRPRVSDQARDNDTSPFYGGAAINVPAGACTAGFPWYSGSTSMMVTAAHCAPNGGSISTPAQHMGLVTASARENRNPGVGTVYLTGQTVYRGDIALIEMPAGAESGLRIYRGGPGSGDSNYIDSMWSRSPENGDQYCTGGKVTGEQCGWVVTRVRYNYTNTGGDVIRNMTEGTKQGQCVKGGDSGGPVYTVLGNGDVVAKGIHSGGSGGGGDQWGGTFDPCFETFTDIWEAFYGFPGVVRQI